MQHEALQKVESEQNEFIEQFILQKWLEIPGKNPISSLHYSWCTKSPEHEYYMVVTNVNQ